MEPMDTAEGTVGIGVADNPVRNAASLPNLLVGVAAVDSVVAFFNETAKTELTDGKRAIGAACEPTIGGEVFRRHARRERHG